MRTLWFASACLATLFVVSATSRAQPAKKLALVKEVLGKAKLSFADALDAAQKKVPEGKPIVARAEKNAKDQLLFGFYFLVGDKVKEVEVDVSSGDVIKVEDKKDPDKVKKLATGKKALQGAKVTYKEAMEIATAKVKDAKIFEVEMEFDGDRAVVEVELFADNKITRVRIDAKDSSKVEVIK